jgi:hypothetical protein
MISRKIYFPVLILSLVFSACGKKFEEKKAEEDKVELSPKEKLVLAKNLLDVGQVSEAKKLFSEALPYLSKDDCVQQGGRCDYCDALYGKYIADFFGTIKLLGDILSSVSQGEQSKTSQESPIFTREDEKLEPLSDSTSDYFQNLDKLVSSSIDTLLGYFLKKFDGMRQDLKEIMSLNCSFNSSATAYLKILNLEIVIPTKNEDEERKEIEYSTSFAKLNYAVLSLLSGVLDIAYSQNYNVSLTYTFDFLKKLTAQKNQSTLSVLQKLAHLFAINPSLLTLNQDRANLWSKSATDIADSLKNLGDFIKELITHQCDKNSNEASVLMISSVLSEIVKSLNLNLVNVCDPGIAKILSELLLPISDTLNKWSESLTGYRSCVVEDNRIKKYPNPNQKEFQSDGCIRVLEDFPLLSSLSLQSLSSPLQILIQLKIAIVPSEFFKPKSLRSLLPFVSLQNGIYVFAFEMENKDEDKEHFSNSSFLFSITSGSPRSVADFYPQGITIENDCISGGLLYIPFADPTFDGALFISTYEMSKDTPSCLSKEQEWGIADQYYLVKHSDIKVSNYAINKTINKLLSSIGGFLGLGK